MAQSNANEQVKEVLRQIIKHRFWIAVGFACLFAVIAYFMGSGPVQAQAKAEIAKIETAEKNVKAYATPTKPTDQYKPIVVEKTEIMSKDVNRAWKELYDRQAPLLTWPDVVKDRIPKWGRKWPAEQDPGKVRLAIVDYIEAYPPYVDMVYNTFDPFNYETGKGIVAAPPKEELLRPAPFSVENGKLPTLGKVWAAQERLWIQRTMLEVVHQVNRNAKDWDTAVVKQITGLEVGSPDAQDQRSIAKGETLTEAPDILSPEQEAAAAASGSEGGGGGGGGGAGAAGGPMAEMMGGGMMAMMGRGGSAQQAADSIYYIVPAGAEAQYKILPVMISALVDQDRVQDLLVELENSPMSVQVKDFELARPSSPVTKPEKGEGPSGGMGGMMMGMGSMKMRRMMMGGRGAYGGMASQMDSMRDMMMQQRGMGGPAMGMGPMGMGGMGAATPSRKGVDIRNQNRGEERKKALEELEKRKGPSLFDPYFNIVEVTVYGQARFYNPPPAEAEAPASPGDAAASPGTPSASGETPAAAAPPADAKAAPPADAKAAPAPPVDAEEKEATPAAAPDAKAAPKAEAPKAEAPKADNAGATPKQ